MMVLAGGMLLVRLTVIAQEHPLAFRLDVTERIGQPADSMVQTFLDADGNGVMGARAPVDRTVNLVAQVSGCSGDCNGDGVVTVNELLTMVNLALGNADAATCLSGDANHDGQITIDEILGAVNNALTGCNGDAVQRGLTAVAAGDLRAAHQAFADAAAANPTDDRANLFLAFARLVATLLDDPQLQTLAARAGVVVSGDSRNVCGVDIALPDTAPAGAPGTGEILETGQTVLLPELAAAVDDLSRVSPNVAVTFNVSQLPNCLQSYPDQTTIEIDYADVLLLRAGLEAAMAAFNMATAYDVDISWQAALDGPTPAVVAAAPQLLTLRFADRLGIARSLLDGALGRVEQAIDLKSGVATDGNHILDILLGDSTRQRQAKALLDLVRQSLNGEVTLPIDVVTGEVVLMDIGLLEQERVDLSRLFAGQIASLRSFVPPADVAGQFDLAQFPDPTLGGMLPDFTQDKVSNFLSGGPACMPCVDDADCNAFGFGDFACGSCAMNCTGTTMRCTSGSDECQDGTFF